MGYTSRGRFILTGTHYVNKVSIRTVKPPLEEHPQDKEKCPLDRGVPLIEVLDFKDYMSVNFAGTKVCVTVNEVSP